MESTRIKNTKRNIISSVFLQMAKILLVFLNRIIFAKILGPSYLGINGLFSTVLGLLSLADLGISTAMMYSLYKPLSDNNEELITKYINYFRKIFNIIAFSILLLGLGLIPFLKYLVNLPEEIPHIYLYYILILINTVSTYLFVYKTTLLSADQKMYIINRYDTIFQFVLFILQIIALLITKSFAIYLIANIICTFLSNVFKVSKTKTLYPYLDKYKSSNLSNQDKKELYKNVFSLFFYRVGSIIQGNTDNILISIFVGTIVVGYYSNYNAIISAVVTFLTLVFTAVKASVGNYVNTKNKKEQLIMFERLEKYNFWLVGFCSVCLIILIPDFILICFGKNYLLSTSLLIWAVLNFYTSNIRQTMWAYRETTNLFVKTKFITIITSIINVFSSIIGGYFWGITGIVAATVISRMIYAWWREPLILYNDYFEISSKSYFVNYIGRLILLTIITIITYLSCYYVNSFNIYINFIIKMIICCVVPIIIFFIVYRKSEDFDYLIKNVLKRK